MPNKLAAITIRSILLIPLGFLAGCPATTGETAVSDNVDAAADFEPSEIIELVYDTTYRVPPGFYVDERANSEESYTLHHVKDESNSFEICTNDYDEAMRLESADHDSRSVQGLYVGSYENSRYFEFVRELAYPDGIGNVPEPTSPDYARVFKCSYVDRTGVDRNLRDGYAGRLAISPLTLEATREFFEYLWQFAFFWPGQAKVLATRSGDNATVLWHVLVLANRTRQGTGTCDRIDVIEWKFSADRSTGELEKAYVPQFSFEAQLLDGIPRLCDGE